MKIEKLSYKNFNRISKIFLTLLNDYFSDDDKSQKECLIIIDKMIKYFKQNPFKERSGYTFKNNGIDYRISFIFTNNLLIFKLMGRDNGSRFRRKLKYEYKLNN